MKNPPPILRFRSPGIISSFIFSILLFTGTAAFSQAPINNDCAGAIEITDVTNWCSNNAAYTNVNATASTYGPPTCWADASNDVWFTFVAEAYDVNIIIYGNVMGRGTLNRPGVALYAGTCGGTINQLACVQATAGNNLATLYRGALAIGTRYYIRVDGFGANTGTFQLCINNFIASNAPGQDCSNAAYLCSKDAITKTNLTGAGALRQEAALTCMDMRLLPGDPIESNCTWYIWRCGTSGTLTMDLIPTQNTDDLDWVVFDFGTTLDCSNKTGVRCTAGSGVTCNPLYYITGMNMASIDTVEVTDCPPGQNGYVKYLNMVAGRYYGILINNFTAANNGFTLQWGGTGTFEGPQSSFTISDTIVCLNEPITVTNTSVLANAYAWSFDAGASIPNTTAAGPHTFSYNTPGLKTVVLEVAGVNGCKVVSFKKVLVIDNSSPPGITSNSPICEGSTLAINAPAFSGATYNWSGPQGFTSSAQNPSIPSATVNMSGYYKLNLSVYGCNFPADSVLAEIFSAGTLSVTPANPSICAGSSVDLTASGAASYAWSPSTGLNTTTGASVKASPSATTTYTITGTSGSCSSTGTVVVTVVPKPMFSLTKNTNVCFANPAVQLKATGGTKYTWTPTTYLNQSNASDVTAAPQNTITYNVLIENDVCPDTNMQVTITVDKPVQPLTLVDSISVCKGNTVSAEAFGNPANYMQWTGPGGFSNTRSKITLNTVMPAMGGYYYVTAYLGPNKYCQFGKDSVFIAVKDSVPVTFSPPNPLICAFDSVLITANGASSYNWHLGTNKVSSSQSYWAFPGNKPAIYEVKGTSPDGCVAYGAVNVSIKPQYNVELGPERFACKGETVKLSLQSPNFNPSQADIRWSTGSASPEIIVGQSGDYSITVNMNGCNYRDTVHVSFQDPSAFSIGADVLKCSNDSAVIDLTGATGTITWNDGSTEARRIFYPPGGQYEVTIQNASCTLKDDIKISFQDQHPVDLGPDANICMGTTHGLSSVYTGANEWIVNGTRSYDDVYFVSDPGLNTVILVVTKGVCINSDTTLVTVSLPPNIDLGDDVTSCEDNPPVLDPGAPAGSSYQWTPGSSSASRLTPSVSGMHYVEVTTGPCTVKDSVLVTLDTVPHFSLGPDVTICKDQVATLGTTQAGTSYLWNTGAATNSITAVTTGMYRLTVFNGACSFADSLLLTVNAPPDIDLGSDQTVCENQTLVLDPKGPPTASYYWIPGGDSSSTKIADIPGKHHVTILDGPCQVMDSIMIFHDPLPVFSLGPDVTICQGQVASIGAVVPGASYSWNTGSNTDHIQVSSSSDYILTVTKGACSLADTIKVIAVPPFTVDLGNDIKGCNQVSMILDTKTPGANYTWSTGENTQSISIALSGAPGIGQDLVKEYAVTVAIGPCVDQDTITITVQKQHMVKLPPDDTICAGTLKTLTAITDAIAPVYLWSTGETTPVISAASTGNYGLTVISGVCSNSASTSLQVVNPSQVSLGPDRLACEGDIVILDPGVFSGVYDWNTGETTRTIQAQGSGNYEVTVTDGPCTVSDNISVQFTEMPVVALMPDAAICENEKITITGNIPAGKIYKWSTGETTPAIITSQPGLYTLRVTDGPCEVMDSFDLTVNKLPSVKVKDLNICPGDSDIFDAFCQGCSYLWSDGHTGPDHSALPHQQFSVKITDTLGCSIEHALHAYLEEDCIEELYVPNSFSPNGDGVNEVFSPIYGNVELLYMAVYNRWGELLFESSEPDKGWDGRHQNQLMKQDVYLLQLVYYDNYRVKKSRSYHFTLLW